MLKQKYSVNQLEQRRVLMAQKIKEYYFSL